MYIVSLEKLTAHCGYLRAHRVTLNTILDQLPEAMLCWLHCML